MTDESRRYPIVRGAVRGRKDWVLNALRPRLWMRPLPLGNLAPALADEDVRIEEPAAVEVI